MLHTPPTNQLLLTTNQEPYKKAYPLNENFVEAFKKRCIVERTSKAEIRPTEQSEKTERFVERNTVERVLKKERDARSRTKRSWQSSVGLRQRGEGEPEGTEERRGRRGRGRIQEQENYAKRRRIKRDGRKRR